MSPHRRPNQDNRETENEAALVEIKVSEPCCSVARQRSTTSCNVVTTSCNVVTTCGNRFRCVATSNRHLPTDPDTLQRSNDIWQQTPTPCNIGCSTSRDPSEPPPTRWRCAACDRAAHTAATVTTAVTLGPTTRHYCARIVESTAGALGIATCPAGPAFSRGHFLVRCLFRSSSVTLSCTSSSLCARCAASPLLQQVVRARV
jgi:hypothetical protein